MTNTDEINNLKTLLEQGALTKEEYETLINKISAEQKMEDSSNLNSNLDFPELKSIQSHDSTESIEQQNQNNKSTYEIRVWNSIFWSGKRLSKAAIALTIGFISSAISFFSLFAGYVELFKNFSRGNSEINFLDNGWFVSGGIFGFIAFVSWILFLTNLATAGFELRNAFNANKPVVDSIKKRIKESIYKVHSDRKKITVSGLADATGLDISIIERYWHIYVTECNSLNKELKKS